MLSKGSKIPTVFVGYDSREHDAYAVCKHTLQETSGATVIPLEHRDLRHRGLFDRPWQIEPDGTFKDIRDGRPFSTEFAHSRFLTPVYASKLGIEDDLVVFVDSDFLFKEDINNLLDQIRSEGLTKTVWCVKHNFTPTKDRKMDNQHQQAYPCKLWSSLMVFNMEPFRVGPEQTYNLDFLVKYFNRQSGRFLHTFQWVTGEDQIGSIDEKWNFIPDHSEPRVKMKDASAIHFTHGVPTMCTGVRYYGEYLKVLDKLSTEELIYK